MFCPECGTNLGTPVNATSVRCPSCGRVIQAGAGIGTSSATMAGGGAPHPAANPSGQSDPTPYYQQPLGMKWYKFVIWFQLFAGALFLVGTGIATMTGATYGDYADLTYLVFDGLKAIDVTYGGACIALAVCYVLVRQELAGFRAAGPRHYLQLLVAATALPIIYLAAVTAITGLDLLEAGGPAAFAGVLGNVVLAAVSKYYFDRRMSCFRN